MELTINLTNLSERQYCYNRIPFDEFLNKKVLTQEGELYENSTAWLDETRKYFVKPNEELLVHCIYDRSDDNNPTLLCALPLISSQKKSLIELRCLSSFYANTITPFFSTSPINIQLLQILFKEIAENNHWHRFRFGAIEQDGLLAQAFSKAFKRSSVYSQSINWYVDELANFKDYYSKRPSRLKNTIKRQEKKLANEHQYDIRVIKNEQDFNSAFIEYQQIYQQSWKQEEFSFEFIEAVCRSALTKNQLRMALIYIDGFAAAGQIWFLQGKKASIFKLAYDEHFKQFSVGSILSKALFEHVITNDQVTEVEYGTGDESYKRDWMNKSRYRVVLDTYNTQTIQGRLFILFKTIKQFIVNIIR